MARMVAQPLAVLESRRGFPTVEDAHGAALQWGFAMRNRHLRDTL